MTTLIAVYARRHEPQWLIDDLHTNLAPWVDGFAVVDDRMRAPDDPWGHEGQMRAAQRQAAIDAGADWVLVVDPDERIEDRAGGTIRPLIEQLSGQPVLLRFALRELFAPTAYRVDGRWGLYRRARLYPVLPGQQMSDKAIHCPPVPINPEYRRIDIDVNLYHLKMIEPANRAARVRAYARAEAAAGVRARQWTPMQRTVGMRLQTIPVGREFTPGYTRPYLMAPRR